MSATEIGAERYAARRTTAVTPMPKATIAGASRQDHSSAPLAFHAAAQIFALRKADHDEGRRDRRHRRQREVSQPFPSSVGIRSPNNTRLAGFEIDSTKLAARAMKAQANR